LVFLAVLVLTLVALGLRVGVAIAISNPSDNLKDAMTTCGLIANAGFGAIIGLLGGKAI
jgi:hypothetical protein